MTDYILDYIYTQNAIAATSVIAGYLLYFLVACIVGICAYILQSVGLFTIAKRRGIKHAWLAWIPVGSDWIFGCISDQYQYVVNEKVRNKRKIILALHILNAVAFVGVCALLGSLVSQALSYGSTLYASDYTDMLNAVGTVLGIAAVSLSMSGIAVAVMVFRYILLYDLYRSCDSGNSVLFLLLSIFFNITMPVFIFVCRNKDLGMPPRKAEVLLEE